MIHTRASKPSEGENSERTWGLNPEERHFAELYAGAQRLAHSLDLDEIATAIVDSCISGFGAWFAWVARAEPDGRLRTLRSSTPIPEGPPPRWGEAGDTQLALSLSKGFPSIIEDPSEDSLLGLWLDQGTIRPDASAGIFPLIIRDQPYGVMVLAGPKGFFTPDRTQFFKAYAYTAAAPLANAQLFREAEVRLRRLGALRSIDLAIAVSLDLRVTLEAVMEAVSGHLDIDAGVVLLMNEFTQELEYAAGTGFRQGTVTQMRVPLGEGLAGRAALERRTIVSDFPAPFAESQFRTRLFSGEEFAAYYAAPLIIKGTTKGVLEIYHRSRIDRDMEWLQFFESMAGQAAIAVDDAEMFDKLQRSNADLTLAYDETLKGWSRALEIRDDETQGHTERVTLLAVRLGRELGMSDQDIMHLRRGSLLHDIGKMGIPDSILRKPGPLDDREWKIMKKHPEYAYELLSRIAFLRPAVDVPHSHHEWWDGSGYPQGLSGTEIPTAARIFAVADVWDALTSDRPYREAWSNEDALGQIEVEAGTHFEPKVAEVFLSLAG